MTINLIVNSLGAGHWVGDIFEPEVQQQAHQVPHRRHGAAGDAARGGADAPRRRRRPKDVPAGSNRQNHEEQKNPQAQSTHPRGKQLLRNTYFRVLNQINCL